MFYKKEITLKLLKDLISIKGLRIGCNKGTKTIRITHKEYEVICDVNHWLLDSFPHYAFNIQYGLPNGNNTCSWLEIICIDK